MKLHRYNALFDQFINNDVIYIVIGILILTVFIWPLYGVTAFLFWLPIQSIFSAEGLFGSVTKWFGLILFLASLTNIYDKRARIFNNREVIIFLLFVLWNLCSILWSQNVDACIFRVFTYLQLFLLYIIIITTPDPRNYPLLIKGFVIGVFLSFLTIPLSSGAGEIFYLRAAGGGMDENEYASTIALGLVLAVTWFLMEKNFWKKIIPLAFIPLGLLAIAYTKSRTGTFALLPFAIYLCDAFKKGIWQKISIIFIITISLMSLFLLMPAGYVDRMTEINEGSGERLYIVSTGLKMILENIILGVGSGNFPVAFPTYTVLATSEDTVAHNSFISVFAELGLVGIFLFIWLFFSHYKKLNNYLKYFRKDYCTIIICKGLLFALMTIIIASMGLAWEYNKVIPFILGSIILITNSVNINRK